MPLFLATNRVSISPAGHLQIVRSLGNGVYEEFEVQADGGIPLINDFFNGSNLDGQWTFTGPDNGLPYRDHIARTPNAQIDFNGNLLGNDDYGFIQIDVPEAEVDFIWQILGQVQSQMNLAQLIDPSKYNYDADYNSNTFINTIMSVVGVDILAPVPALGESYASASAPANVTGGFLPPPLPSVFVPQFPGINRNAFKDAEYPNDAINLFLFGNEGNNTINTGWGNDTIIASTGNDVFDGSLGFDTVDYSAESTSTPAINNVVASIGSSSVIVAKPNGESDVFTNFESIKGTEQADSFSIDALVGQLVYINGVSPVPPFAEPLDKDGNPLESADGGRNLSAAQAVAASGVIYNTTGNEDSIFVSQALFDAGAEVTYLTEQGEGVIWLETGGVTQKITYTGIFNEVEQTEFFGGLPEGTTTGLNEFGEIILDFSGSLFGITAEILSGIDLFNLVDDFGGSGDDTVIGTVSDNMLSGGDGDDDLFGGNGDDTLIGGLGADDFDGGAGSDTVDYSSATEGVWADLQGLVAQMGEALGDTFVDVENIIGSDFVDRLYGDAADNIISGGAGNDALFGRNGNDTLDGGLGNDFLIGGSGDDVLAGGEGDDQIQGNLGDDTIFGGRGNDFLTRISSLVMWAIIGLMA